MQGFGLLTFQVKLTRLGYLLLIEIIVHILIDGKSNIRSNSQYSYGFFSRQEATRYQIFVCHLGYT